MLGYYNYTVILTYLGAASAFWGITAALGGHIPTSLFCMLICGLCDMFDGLVASTRKRSEKEKRFGIQIDSLCDLVCFGVFPAIVVYTVFCRNVVGICISVLYVLAAIARLAYFNVDEEDRQLESDGARKHYLGLPVTTASLILPALVCVGGIFSLPMLYIAPAVLATTAVLFLSPFRMKKPARTGKIVLIALGAAEFVLLLFARKYL